ncbi:hypothetical protein [Streptomyces clavifer]|uniref:hypothetical protein n=1 Tax=Streptomyces clavifer TaxID=68188 RepID=UPI00365B7BE9
MSTAMMVVAPATRAAITALRPTAPAPVTAKLEPAVTFSARNTVPAPVWIPAAERADELQWGVLAHLDRIGLVGDRVAGEGGLA